MGKFEHEFFEKHFATIERLMAFRKKFNEWNTGHNNGEVVIEFNHKSWHFAEDGTIVDNTKNEPCKFIRLTKHKVDKEIKRRFQENTK